MLRDGRPVLLDLLLILIFIIIILEPSENVCHGDQVALSSARLARILTRRLRLSCTHTLAWTTSACCVVLVDQHLASGSSGCWHRCCCGCGAGWCFAVDSAHQRLSSSGGRPADCPLELALPSCDLERVRGCYRCSRLLLASLDMSGSASPHDRLCALVALVPPHAHLWCRDGVVHRPDPVDSQQPAKFLEIEPRAVAEDDELALHCGVRSHALVRAQPPALDRRQPLRVRRGT
mmetsp:Transcript_21169/g.37657  ORF Transcript_21169/g.37657 Transcript_21169/m.37657 type:complete len:234 (+) Transcript_21169:758-1459(+)